MEPLNNPPMVPVDSCSIDKISERILSIKQALVEHTLPVLVVESSSNCNFACVFCGMHSKSLSTAANTAGRKRSLPKMHIDLELFRETIRKCKGLEKLKVLYLHGNGEPLLNPHIVEMVDIAGKANIAEKIVLVTNGLLLGEKMFRDLVAAGATGIRVSLDIISRDKFREVKGADAAERVVRNVEACINLVRDERLPVTFNIICSDPESADQEYVKETRKILEHFGEKIADLPQVVIQYRKLFNWVDSINRITEGGKYRRPVPCEQPFYLLMVHADGDVSMCCADVMKELLVGNIRQVDSLKDILASEALQSRRKSLLDQSYRGIPACGHCEVYSAVDNMLLEKSGELLKFLS